jgi:hypothetical protein
MAYIQKLGRGNHSKTGHGVPTPFLQVNISSGNDLKAKAKAEAEKKVQAIKEASGLNPGGSKDVRNFEASATVTAAGKKVEKFAKTPAEIAAWKKAKPENLEKYKSQSVTETAKLSDIGTDKPKQPVTPAPKPKDFGSWTKESTSIRNAGGGSVTGYTEKSDELEAGDIKNYVDKYQGKDVTQFANATSGQNQYKHSRVTPQESRIQGVFGNTVSPYNEAWSDKKGANIGSGETRRQEYITSKTSELDIRDKTFKEKAMAEKTKGEAMVKAGEERKLKILAERATRKATATPLNMRLKVVKKKK